MRKFIIFVLPWGFGAGIAGAHPHLFLDLQVLINVNEQGLDGLDVIWQFDEMNSNMLIPEIDLDNDGKFNASEKLNFDADFDRLKLLAEFPYIFVEQKNVWDVKALRPFIKNELLYYELPMAPKTKLDSKNISLQFCDPSNFTAFTLEQKSITIKSPKKVQTDFKLKKFSNSHCSGYQMDLEIK